jgi:hypothetical protein
MREWCERRNETARKKVSQCIVGGREPGRAPLDVMVIVKGCLEAKEELPFDGAGSAASRPAMSRGVVGVDEPLGGGGRSEP